MAEVPLTAEPAGAGHGIPASSARQSSTGKVRSQSLGEGCSTGKLSECTTNTALVEGGAVDDRVGADLVDGGVNKATGSSAQTVIRGGGRPSGSTLGLTQEGGGMDGLTTGGSDRNKLNFFAQRLGGAGESALNELGYFGGVGGSSTECPHDRWG